MFYPNYYPYHYYNNYKKQNNTINQPLNETIPFKDFQNSTIPNNDANTNSNVSASERKSCFNLLGINLEIDDLIIIGLIILLFLESDKNYALIIILGLILLNVNLSDILNIF